MNPCRINPYNPNGDCANSAIMRIRWSMNFDPLEIITSNICQECFDKKPSFVKVIEIKRLEG